MTSEPQQISLNCFLFEKTRSLGIGYKKSDPIAIDRLLRSLFSFRLALYSVYRSTYFAANFSTVSSICLNSSSFVIFFAT